MSLPQVPFRLPGFALDSVQPQGSTLMVEAHPTSETALEQLQARSYKWDDKKDGKDMSNWILLTTFVEELRKKGWEG